MSKYFISVYKNYLDKIESDKGLEARCNDLKDKMTLLNTSFNNYVDSIENSSWTELGKNEILNSYIPKVKQNINVLSSGVLNNLDKVINLVKNDLYKLLVELKEKDEEYCKLQDKVKSNDLSSSDLEYTKTKLNTMDSILIGLVKNIDNKIIEIKSYNDLSSLDTDSSPSTIGVDISKEDLLALYLKTHNSKDDKTFIGKLKKEVELSKLSKMFSGNISLINNSINVSNEGLTENNMLENANCVDLSLLNENWKVINTKMSVSEYASSAYNKGIRQNSNPSRYGDYCLAFSYVHASNLYNGTVDANAECAYNWNHASEFYDYFNDNKNETLKTIYNQVIEGKPVVMQVNGNKTGTSRHFVTVVGVKSNVTNANNVKESDLLILDSWDGQLERMDTATSRFMTTGKQTNKNYSGYYLRILK